MNTHFPLQTYIGIPQYLQAPSDQIIRCIAERKYCAILGPRFSGKTELLNSIMEELKRKSRTYVSINLHHVVATRQADFFFSLAKVIVQSLKNEIRIMMPLPPEGITDSANFRSFIRDALDALQNDLILVIDHLEGAPNDLVRALLTCLRVIFMERNEEKGQLIVIIAGALSLADVAIGETSPFRGIAERVMVDLPPDDEGRRYAEKYFSEANIQISSATWDLFTRMTRGDQILLNKLCERCTFLLSNRPSKRLSISLLKQAIKEFIFNDAEFHEPFKEAIHLIESEPDLLISTLLLVKNGIVRRQQLPISLAPDIDPFYLTGVVRTVEQDSYQFRNEIYQQFLTQYFNPGRVGHLLTISGRWDAAIDHLENSIRSGNEQYWTDLLAAAINSMYAADNVERASYYLARGLSAAFGVTEACIWLVSQAGNSIRLIEQLGITVGGALYLSQEIPLDADSLETRAFREAYTIRGEQKDEYVKYAIPLVVSKNNPIGVVTLNKTIETDVALNHKERELQLVSFLNQAARALQEVGVRQKREILVREQDLQLEQKTQHLILLQLLSTLMQRMTDLEKILHLILTGITAHFGLGFNRAWLFLISQDAIHLNGRMGIGNFTHEAAYRSWEGATHLSFEEYIKQLLTGEIEVAEIDKPTRQLNIPISESSDDMFSRTIYRRHTNRWSATLSDWHMLNNDFWQLFEPDDMILTPLVAEDRCLGLIVVDNKFRPHPYTNADEEMLKTFANQAAAAIASVNERQQKKQQLDLDEILREVSIVIGRSLELKEVFRLISEQMGRVLPFDTASLQLLDTENGVLKIVAAIGFDDNDAVEKLTFSLEESFPNVQVLRFNNSLRFSDVLDKFPHFSNSKYHATKVRSWLGAPLTEGATTIGVITLDSFIPNLYSSDHERLAMLFANHATVAIQNARLFEQTKQRGEQLAAMDQIAVDIAKRMPIKELLRAIVQQAVGLMQGFGGGVYLWDEAANVFRLESVYNLSSSLEGQQFEKDQGIIGEVFRTKLPYAIADYQNWSKRLHILDKYKLTAVLGAPIMLGNRLLGVIVVHDSTDARVFREDEKEFLHRLGYHVAVALENARLFEQLDTENTRRMIESQALQNVGISLTETIELNEVLDRVMQAALELTQGDEGSILFFDEARDEFLPDALLCKGIGEPLYPYQTQTRQHKGLAYKIVKERTFVIISNTESDIRISKVAINKGRRAMVGVPLISHSGSVGVLWVNWKNSRQLSEREANILTALASQASVAIQGAKRYAEIQNYARLREALLKAGNEITSLQELSKKLKSITEIVLKALNCDLVTLYTFDKNKDELTHPPVSSGRFFDESALKALGFVSRKSIVWKILESGKSYFTDDSQHDNRMILADAERSAGVEPFVMREKIVSSGGIPLLIGNGKVGILFVNFRINHRFTEQEKIDIGVFATQAAMAIHNARQFEDIQKRGKHLKALFNSARSIAASAGRDSKKTLDFILKQAVLITSISGGKTTLATIQILDKQKNELVFTNFYPPNVSSKLIRKLGPRFSLDKAKSFDKRIGITGRAVIMKTPQLVHNVNDNLDYIPYSENTKSELAVPLLDDGQVIGVIDVESSEISGFDGEDEKVLVTLADLAVVTIKAAKQTEKLSRANGVALMGALSADIIHDIKQEVGSIQRTIFLLQRNTHLNFEVRNKINLLESYAEKLMIPPLLRKPGSKSSDANTTVDLFLQAEVKMWEQKYPDMNIQFNGRCGGVQVAMHERWLGLLLKHLITNAIKAIPKNKNIKKVVIHTNVENSAVEISVEDNGNGIPPNIASKLFLEPISHKKGEEGQGLILVGSLVEQHNGNVGIKWNELEKGACLFFTVPIVNKFSPSNSG